MSWTWETDRSPAWASGSSSMPMSREQPARVAAHPVVVDEARDATAREAAQPDVLHDAARRDRVELLLDHRDAGVASPPAATAKRTSLPGERRSRRRRAATSPNRHVHERRLAGAVLAAQGVDGARPDGEVDVVERGDARERLGDAAHARAANSHGAGAVTAMASRLDRRRRSRRAPGAPRGRPGPT